MTTPLKPTGRTLAEFQPLKPAEQKLLEACRQGTSAHISNERPEAANDDNIVRASFLRFLVLGGDEQAPVHEHGVQLFGAWIEGDLDMVATRVPSDLAIGDCHFDTTPVFRSAKIAGSLNLGRCQLPGFAGNSLTCDGDLLLRLGFTAMGEVQLIGAQIGGDLDCSGAKLDGKEGDALSVDGAVIKGSVFLNTGFTAMGAVRFPGAQIGGGLYCHSAKFDGREGNALLADRMVIKNSVFLDNGFTAAGKLSLLGAQIGGNLTCSGAKFNGKEGVALSADGLVIKGSVFLNEDFTATGAVRLLRAQVGSDLNCRSAKFDGKEGVALSIDGAFIKGFVFLDDGSATGEVRLQCAQIGGDLSCTGAKFDGKDGDALVAEGMRVEGTFFFRNMVSPVDGVSLAGSYVGHLADDNGSWGERLHLDGFIYGSIVGNAPTDAATRLDWLNKQYPDHAGLNGDGATFKPQPWRQLAHVLREMGHIEDARQVAIAFEHRLRKANLIGQTPKYWGKLRSWLYRNISRGAHWLFWLLTGYGYRPLRLIGWMLRVWLVCAVLYWYAALAGVFGPSDPLVFQNPEYKTCRAGNWYLCEKLPEEYTGFSPLAYSLDVILPFVDLQQEKDWSPLIPTPKDTWYKELLMFDAPKHCIRLLLWFEILFGWVASLLLVAVVSGLTKRREE